MKNKRFSKYFILIVILLLLCNSAFASIPKAVISEFDGKKIGLQPASTQEALASKIFKDPEISYYNSIQDAILALENKKIDALFGDDLALRYAAGRTESLAVLNAGGEEINASCVFQKSKRGELLCSQFNDFLYEYKSSGKLASLTSKWFDGPEELRIMDNSGIPDINGTINIVTEIGYAPFEYIKDGKLVGFEIELISDFCREEGYKPVFSNSSFDSLIMGVFTGKFDIALSGLTITEERKQSVTFGQPFLTIHNGLLVRKDANWTGISNTDKTDNTESAGFIPAVRDGIMRTFVEENRWAMFVSGIWTTLKITVLSVLSGTVLGFLLYLLCRNGNKVFNIVTRLSRWFITEMPLVVFLMVLFYIVLAKTKLNGTAVSIVGFTIVFGFTMFDLLESGEQAIDLGQKEVSYALGYGNLDTYLRIILPQAAKFFMPSYLTEVSSLVKATAVVGYITVVDVTRIGDIVRGRTYDAVFPLLAVVISYFILSAACKILIKMVIRKIDTKQRPRTKIMKGVTIR